MLCKLEPHQWNSKCWETRWIPWPSGYGWVFKLFELLAVALGGALGSIMRHGLSVMAIRCGLYAWVGHLKCQCFRIISYWSCDVLCHRAFVFTLSCRSLWWLYNFFHLFCTNLALFRARPYKLCPTLYYKLADTFSSWSCLRAFLGSKWHLL